MLLTAHSKKRFLRPASCSRLIIFFSLFFVHYGYGQTIDLNLKNATLEQAFRAIEAKVEQRFVYTRQMLEHAQPVTVKLKGQPLTKVLEAVFQNQPLSYELGDRFITVRHQPIANSSTASASVSVKGRVLGENGVPLQDATVRLLNSSAGVTTGIDGSFELTNAHAGDVLSVSNVGYQTKEVVVSPGFITVQLQLAITSLDETMVIAYGKTTRRLSTGTVGRVSYKDIERQPVSNPLAGLQGRVSGLNVVQSSGVPGNNLSVIIRGRNSIQSGNSPLFIIDGVPFLNDADRLTQVSQVNSNSPFNTINPADIESIEVLKDADATAIYGSRGANGVILITTKKGKAGKSAVDFNFSTGWGKSTHRVQYMNTEQYLAMRREAFANDGATPTIGNAPDLMVWNKHRYTDWKKLLIGGTAQVNNANLRLSGGNSMVTYALSGNYFKETTVFPGDAQVQRKSVALSLENHSANNRFSASTQASFGSTNSQLYQLDLTQFINTVPNAPAPYDSTGKLNWMEGGSSFNNPMAQLLRTYDVVTDRLTANTVLSYRIGGLALKTSIGYNSVQVDERTRFPIASQNPANNPRGTASFSNNIIKSWVIEPQAEYRLLFGKKGVVSSLAGATWQESVNNSQRIIGSGYTNDFLLNSTTGAANLTATAIQDLTYRFASLFARSTMQWDKRYLLNLSYRRDGSSRFGPESRFANFGALGAGWVFREESFIRKTIPLVSYGKLRGSYGVTGNDQIGDYQYLDTWSGTTYPYGGIAGITPTRITNAYYSWEQKKNIEISVDLGFDKDRFLVTANYFRSRSDNQIIRYTLPDQTGSNSLLMNFPGVVQNTGWEIEATATVFDRKSFQWKSNFNITFPRNKLVSFPGLQNSSYVNTYKEGEPLSILRGYRFLGVNPATGIYTYEDRNGDGRLNLSDHTWLGHTDPQFYGGWQHVMNWKGVELQLFFQFSKQQGREVLYSNTQRLGSNINQPIAGLNRWTKPGDVKPYQRYTQASQNPAFVAGGLISTSDAVLTDASYVRFKNASVSYDLNSKWIHPLKLSKARLYATGQNLLTLTRYEGPDPESQGRFFLPPLRVITVGVQINF